MSAAAEAALRRAEAAMAAGRPGEAALAYREALAIIPDLPDSWYNLARALRMAGQGADALAAYDEALARGASGAEEIHLNRAVIFSDLLADPAAARTALEQALALRPDYHAGLLNLGNLEEDLGNAEAARAAYRRLLGLAPGHPMALARLAQLDGAQDDPGLERTLRAAWEGARGGDRATLGFALAHYLDRAGRHDEAFAAARAANADSRAAAGGIAYDPAQAEALVDRLIATFDGTGPTASPGPAPLFICGMFRSGSTLLEQILAAQGDFRAGGERDFLPRVAPALPPYRAGTLDRALLDRLAAGYRAAAAGAMDGAMASRETMTDKRPDNWLHLGLGRAMFPDARALVTRRHPLDNIVSLYFLHLDPRMAYALDLESAGHWFVQQQRLTRHWQQLAPDAVCEVDYDRLVAEPEPTLRALFGFLGVPWRAECLEFHRLSNPVKTASAWQVRRPLTRASSGRWKAYAEALAPVRRQLEAAGVDID